MGMSKDRLNQIWWSGYCEKAVIQASTTDFDEEGAKARLRFLKSHLPNCQECMNAALLKSMEADTAQAMGPKAFSTFQKGGDITDLPGGKEAAGKTMAKAMSDGRVDARFIKWMAGMSQRAGTPFKETN